MPEQVLVSDTNIWIDLHRGGLLNEVFRLPYDFVTTDFVWQELQRPDGQSLEDLGLTVHGLASEVMSELVELMRLLNNSSLADVSCYYLAQAEGWTLLTNDGAVRKAARKAEMDVRGVLWLLDELCSHDLVAGAQLAQALKLMLDAGARLPRVECEIRVASWEA